MVEKKKKKKKIEKEKEKEKKVIIREYNEERDSEVVGKVEKNCEIGYKRGVSIFTNIMGDPLSRIRFYPLHIMLVAELVENGEIVGVVRGCIKSVGTSAAGEGETQTVKIGCILGLRVSPAHRRLGIGLKLVHSVEEWILRNGARYTFLAIEKKNIASKNLFTHKCNYIKFSSLVIFRQPIIFPTTDMSKDIKIEKLNIDQAISFYRNCLTSKGKGLYPMDFDMILKEKLSLGTWVSYFKHEDWTHLICSEKNTDIYQRMPSSWVVFSIWNTCRAYKFQVRESNHPLKFLNSTLRNARRKFVSCFNMPVPVSFGKSFGFFFLYGIFGEGERVGELVESLWLFASKLAEDEKDCKAIVTELSASDPIIKHVPQKSSMSRVNDNWYLKRLSISTDDKDEIMSSMEAAENVIVDPRDF